MIADLMSNGIQVALPISEHLPFDLIAIQGNKMSRVSVKYRELTDGVVTVLMQHTWVNTKGVQWSSVDKDTFDATVIYCPNTRKCYFIKNNEIQGQTIVLRINETKNQQKMRVKYAKDFVGAKRLFARVT